MTTTYSGPSVAAAFAVGVINDAWAKVDSLEAEAATARAAVDAALVAVAPAPIPDPLADKFGPVDATLNAEGVSEDADWSTRGPRLVAARASIVAQISQDAKYFINEYFGDPLDGTGVYDQASAWIERILDYGGTGVAAEAELRNRDGARIAADGVRAGADLAGIFKVRGFTVPVQALAYMQRGVDVSTADLLADAARTAAIHSWDTEVSLTAWSVERAQALRREALDSARDYIAQWMQLLYARETQREARPLIKTTELQDAYFKYMQQELGLRNVAVDRYLVAHGDRMKKWRDREQLKKVLFALRVKNLTTQADSLAARASSAINAISVGTAATAQEQT